MRVIRPFPSLIVAVIFISFLPVSVHALTPARVFDKVKDSVVVVKTLDAPGKVKGQGSGVLISANRVALVIRERTGQAVSRAELIRAVLDKVAGSLNPEAPEFDKTVRDLFPILKV